MTKDLNRTETKNAQTFCVLLIDHSGHISSIDEIEAVSDEAAIGQALRHYQCGPGRGFEIWQDNRKVYARFSSSWSRH
jgi:hypothetical protein